MTVNPKNSSETEMFSFPFIETAQANTSADSKEKQYKSGWEILPDLVANLLRGCESQQEFKMRSFGRYQGTIRVRLFNNGTYHPKIGESGSLEVAFMVEPVLKFLSKPALSSFYDLKDETTILLISSLFREVMKGITSKTYSISDNSEIKYQYCNQNFSLSVVKQDPLENHSAVVSTAENFFNSIDLSFVFGKIKS